MWMNVVIHGDEGGYWRWWCALLVLDRFVLWYKKNWQFFLRHSFQLMLMYLLERPMGLEDDDERERWQRKRTRFLDNASACLRISSILGQKATGCHISLKTPQTAGNGIKVRFTRPFTQSWDTIRVYFSIIAVQFSILATNDHTSLPSIHTALPDRIPSTNGPD
jgi:hypothetical protein